MSDDQETSVMRFDANILRTKKRDYVAQAKAADLSLVDWVLRCCDEAVERSQVLPPWLRGLNVRTALLIAKAGFKDRAEVERAMANPDFDFAKRVPGWSRVNFSDLESWV